jgi:hypothetical protein
VSDCVRFFAQQVVRRSLLIGVCRGDVGYRPTSFPIPVPCDIHGACLNSATPVRIGNKSLPHLPGLSLVAQQFGEERRSRPWQLVYPRELQISETRSASMASDARSTPGSRLDRSEIGGVNANSMRVRRSPGDLIWPEGSGAFVVRLVDPAQICLLEPVCLAGRWVATNASNFFRGLPPVYPNVMNTESSRANCEYSSTRARRIVGGPCGKPHTPLSSRGRGCVGHCVGRQQRACSYDFQLYDAAAFALAELLSRRGWSVLARHLSPERERRRT